MPKGKGTYGDQVGRPSKEDKSKGMPYAPFKMSGHTLPGPNQRSALKRSGGSRDGLADTGMFGAKSKLAYFNAKLAGRAQGTYEEWKLGGQTPVGSSIKGNEQPQETQAYVDTGIDDSSVDTGMDDSGADTLATEENTTKVPVDVEVTVNDKKI